jgi:hypothetical protein
MTLTGGKRKVNKSLKAWVAFVKRVQKEEKLNYKDAIHRAKVRKDKGEKWMVGGQGEGDVDDTTVELDETIQEEMPSDTDASDVAAKEANEPITGGRRKTRRRRGSSKKSKKSRKTKRRKTRRR